MDQIDREKFSREAYNQISLLYEEFKNEITELINNLDLFGKGNLKFLAMKLDYNSYYSQREIENFHRKHRERNYLDKNDDEEEEEIDGGDGEQYEDADPEDYRQEGYDDENNHENYITNEQELDEPKQNNNGPYLNPRKNNKINLQNKNESDLNDEVGDIINSNEEVGLYDYKQAESNDDETIRRFYNNNASESRAVNMNDFLFDKASVDKNSNFNLNDDVSNFENYSFLKKTKK